MNLVERAKNIILKPKETWPEIKNEQTTIANLYISYAAIFAAIPAIAKFIGFMVIGAPMVVHYGAFSINFLWSVVLSYVLSLVGIFVAAFITNALAPSFESRKNKLNATKVVVFSWTPYWVAGILYIIPHLSILVLIASFYGIYLFCLGIPILMDTPKEKVLGYVVVVVISSAIVFFLMGAIAGGIFALGQIGSGSFF
jgi:hypothetical protein